MPFAMRTLILSLLICCSLGCKTQPQKTGASQSLHPINRVTPEQLATAKYRIHLIQAGMTDGEVFATLGLSGCYGRCFANAGGGFSHFWVSYTLPNGHALFVIHDFTGPQVRGLRSVSLDGESWTRDEKD